MLENLGSDPLKEFESFWQEYGSGEFENGQMATLATVNSSGQPSARIVLFKKITETGFTFFSNYESRKAEELEGNARASAVVYWLKPDLQIRFMGSVRKMDEADSEAYFATRARGSQISAWASRQSSAIESREHLDAEYEKFEQQFSEKEIPRPRYWGGYVFEADEIQFMVRKEGRLHDSFRYTKSPASWTLDRLAP